MKHARKMVLVDVNTIPSQPKPDVESSLTKAINSLAASNEFTRTNFGPNAIAMSYMDKEMKDILERTDIDPSLRLQLYNQVLQKYLFRVRESEKSNTVTPKPETSSKPETVIPETTSFETVSTIGSEPEIDTSVFETPKPDKPFVFTGAPRKSNLPRTSPKELRLRSEAVRKANSRFKDFFTTWDPYVKK